MKIEELIKDLIEETVATQRSVPTSLSFEGEWAGFRNIDGFGSLNVSRKMNVIVNAIAKTFYDSDKALATTWTREDWTRVVDRMLMPMIAKCDLDNDRNAEASELVRNLIASLEREKRPSPFSILFGCYVFSTDLKAPIIWGPVSFWPRLLWLDKQIERNAISAAVCDELKRKWREPSDYPRSTDSSEERAIVRSIESVVGPCSYVCEVALDGHSGASAESKALMAMRFGLTGIALSWQIPSKALFNMPSTFDGLSHSQATTILSSGRIWPGGVRRTAGFGQSLINLTWEEIEADYREIFSAVTEVIEYVLDAGESARRPKLMDAFAHSLLWFHEACRESLPMVAVAKYVASMDALAYGSGSATGLVKALTAIFGVTEDRPIRENGPTFKDALTDLYSQGRSRLLHGNSDKLMHDWESSRALAENFARLALVISLEQATKNPDCVDPKSMLQRLIDR